MPKAAPDGGAPDLLLTGVHQPDDMTPCDILLSGGRVAAIAPAGSHATVPPGTRRVEFDGRFVIPGLWDEHVHMNQWALTLGRVDQIGRAHV